LIVRNPSHEGPAAQVDENPRTAQVAWKLLDEMVSARSHPRSLRKVENARFLEPRDPPHGFTFSLPDGLAGKSGPQYAIDGGDEQDGRGNLA
jgi:hypothetical protein